MQSRTGPWDVKNKVGNRCVTGALKCDVCVDCVKYLEPPSGLLVVTCPYVEGSTE